MRTGIILLAAAGLLAMPAFAQPPAAAPGAARPQSAAEQVAARRTLLDFAACLMRRNARLANNILLQPLASIPQQEAIDRAVAGVRACSAGGASYNALTLTGALSEVALKNRFAGADVGRLGDLTNDAVTIANLDPHNGYEELGLCVARRAPEAVLAWALTVPGSAEETNARSAVIPQVGPCVNQGQPLRADYVGLRAILSAALYRALRLTRV